jgi:hypothetical protein
LVQLDLEISLRIFELIRNQPKVIIKDLGKMIHEKNMKKISRDTVYLKYECKSTCSNCRKNA